jgi:predicted Zn finger-like uncharacterized protein
MSLKTRCPACETVFKIVPDQLKVSSGWVRCGRCAEVFDAASHSVASDATTLWPQTNTERVTSTRAEDISPASQRTTKNIAEQVINTPATAILSSKNENNSIFKQLVTDEGNTDLTFVRLAQKKAFWQRTAVVYSQRNHLAASNPAFKTGFETLCQSVGCAIEPFKNIDAFKIDSSSFQKSQPTSTDTTPGENFALKIAIKNSAELAVAMPAVELTLTDANDKPVLRRVLLAKELGFSADTLAPNGDWSGTMAVTVASSTAKTAISGYRVLLFYP